MTVPTLHPNDYRFLPRKVLRRFWKEHLYLDNFRDEAKKSIIADTFSQYNKFNIKTIVQALEKKEDKEALSPQELISDVLLIVLYKTSDKESNFFLTLLKIIKILNEEQVDEPPNEKVIETFLEYFDDAFRLFTGSYAVKDFFDFKYALAAQIKSCIERSEDEKKIYAAIARKYLFKSSISAQEQTEAKKALDSLKKQYNLHDDNVLSTGLISRFNNLLKKSWGIPLIANSDLWETLNKIKIIFINDVLSDTDKFAEITKVEATFPEIYDGEKASDIRKLITDSKLYLNPNYIKAGTAYPLEYHVTVSADPQSKLSTVHTLNIRMAKLVKERMKHVFDKIVGVLEKTLRITKAEMPSIKAQLSEIMKGNCDSDVFTFIKNKSNVEEPKLKYYKIHTLIYQLKALSKILSSGPMTFSFDEIINRDTLLAKTGMDNDLKNTQDASCMSWFLSAFSGARYLFANVTGMQFVHDSIHDVLATVADDLSNQRKQFFNTFKISPDSDLATIKKNMENHTSDRSPLPQQTTCGFIFG